ncbi:MAG TPA: hypothetical protein VF134_01685 [Candidatus Dormibacteraeota bacterium]
MSRIPTRLVATLLVGAWLAAGSTLASAAQNDNAWVMLAGLPEQLEAPVFALAVSPADSGLVLAGTPTGAIYRSTDRGQSWRLVHRDTHAVLTIAFNPYKPSTVDAGLEAGGVLRSADGGQTWSGQAGTEKVAGRSFGFARSFTLVGTDAGLFVSRDATPGWTSTGLAGLSVSALAVAAGGDPSQLVAGGDASHGNEALPLYASADGGATWNPINGITTAGNMVSALASGPPPPKSDTRPLLMGTNTALYQSGDSGKTWQQVTGGGILPATDFTAMAFNSSHPDRYYAASDGGASDRGGIWSTSDSGQHFASLRSPVPAITALAVSADEQPTVYIATFRPADHAVMLFAYHDTGGQPQGAAQPIPPVPSPAPATTASPGVSRNWLVGLLTGPEAPYLALGTGAAVVLVLAFAAYITRARSRRL